MYVKGRIIESNMIDLSKRSSTFPQNKTNKTTKKKTLKNVK